jgi:hypothetical protein
MCAGVEGYEMRCGVCQTQGGSKTRITHLKTRIRHITHKDYGLRIWTTLRCLPPMSPIIQQALPASLLVPPPLRLSHA